MLWLVDKLDFLYDAALALVYPQPCAACGAGASVERRADAPVCAPCWEKTHLFSEDDLLCWKCGAPGTAGETSGIPAEWRTRVRCHRCETDSFTAARAIGLYQGALRAAVLALKHEPHVGARLARLLFEAQRRSPLDTATRIVPVPLHPERERARGFNQALVLARSLAALTGLPLDHRSLIRALHSERYRAGMDARTRHESVREAFQVKRPRLIEGARILLIDDVFTTGATVASCAEALRAAGATEVYVLTVARAADVTGRSA